MTATETPPIDPGPAVPAPVVRRLALSTAAQMGSKVLHLALNLVSSLALIRYFTPAAYGDLVLALTVSTLWGLVPDFGLAKLAVREVARDHGSEDEVIGTVLMARVLLALLAVVGVQATLLILGAPSPVRAAALVLSLIFVSEALLTVVVSFHVRIEQHLEAVVRIAAEVIETALVLFLISRRAPLLHIAAAPAATAVLAAGAAIVLARRRYGLRPRVSRHRLAHLVREALPIGPALLLGVVWLKLGGILLAGFHGGGQVGIYGAAFQPIEYLLLASAILINVLFPVLSEQFATATTAFSSTYATGTRALLAAVLPVPVLLATFGESLVTTAYGSGFVASALPLQILSIALVFMVLSVWHGFVLLAAGRQRISLRYEAAALPLAAVLGLALMPRHGAVGAAAATTVTSAAVAVAATACTRRALGVCCPLVGLLPIAGATGLLAATSAALDASSLPWPAALTLAAASYPVWLLATGSVRLTDVRAAFLPRSSDGPVATGAVR